MTYTPKMGLSTMAIGGGTAVGGAAISATGVGSPIGALLIVDGIAGIGTEDYEKN